MIGEDGRILFDRPKSTAGCSANRRRRRRRKSPCSVAIVNLANVEFRCAHWLAKLDERKIFNETERENGLILCSIKLIFQISFN